MEGQDGEDDEEDSDFNPDGSEEGGEGQHQVVGLQDSTKASAIACLAHVLEYAGGVDGARMLSPYLAPVLECLTSSCGHYDHSVRQEAIKATPAMLTALARACPPGVDGRLPEPARAEFEAIVAKLSRAIAKDHSRPVVSSACDAFSRVCNRMGALTLSGGAVIQPLVAGLLAIVNGEAPCQMEEGDDDLDEEDEEEEGGAGGGRPAGPRHARAAAEEEEGEDASHDYLLDDATDALTMLARISGPAFAPFLGPFLGALEKYTSTSRPVHDQLVAVGCYGDLIAACGLAMAPHARPLLATLLRGARTEGRMQERGLQRNCAYSLGVYAERLPELARPSADAILGALGQLLRLPRGGSSDMVVDNAAAAVCRLLSALPELAAGPAAGPALAAVVASLPLVEDHDEDAVVFGTCLRAAAAGHPAVLPHVPALLRACCTALGPASGVTPDVQRNIVRAGLRALPAGTRVALDAALAAAHLSPEAVWGDN
jgi:hypothetical protein